MDGVRNRLVAFQHHDGVAARRRAVELHRGNVDAVAAQAAGNGRHMAGGVLVVALGADGVLVARPFVTAVYGGGADGVAAYVEKLGAELADTMRLCGAASLADISRDMVRVVK